MIQIWDWFLSRTHAAECKPGSWGALLLRAFSGLSMAIAHGWGKLTGFDELSAKFADPFGIGMTASLALTVFAEFFCALAVAIGLFTRGALIPLIIAMGTAAFWAHGDDPFGRKEKALLYLVIFVALLFTGPGRYAVDRLFRRR